MVDSKRVQKRRKWGGFSIFSETKEFTSWGGQEQSGVGFLAGRYLILMPDIHEANCYWIYSLNFAPLPPRSSGGIFLALRANLALFFLLKTDKIEEWKDDCKTKDLIKNSSTNMKHSKCSADKDHLHLISWFSSYW